jgi:hypothetical protein
MSLIHYIGEQTTLYTFSKNSVLAFSLATPLAASFAATNLLLTTYNQLMKEQG